MSVKRSKPFRSYYYNPLSSMLLCIIFLGPICHCENKSEPQKSPPKVYTRIISLAPSITETLFALGMGDKVVGVTSFCHYPSEAKKIPSIGGYTDPNFEMMIRAKPDLVVLMKEHHRVIEFLNKNHMEYLLTDNRDLSSIQESIMLIGKKCGKIREADGLVALIKNEVSQKNRLEKPPRVLVCIDRDNRGSGSIARIFAAGRSTFYNDFLIAAGMENTVDGRIAYPQISAEGIIYLQPDIIIDITPPELHLSPKSVEVDWKSLNMVPAIKNHMVFCLTEDYLMVPGPRVYMILRDFNRIANTFRRCADARH
jgi:iron complex transport system substrate-binding protein